MSVDRIRLGISTRCAGICDHKLYVVCSNRVALEVFKSTFAGNSKYFDFKGSKVEICYS